TLKKIHRDRDLTFASSCETDIMFRGERHDLEEILGNLLDNAAKWTAERVAVHVSYHEGRIAISIDDDGPGLAPQQREEVLQRGRRLDESVPGSGLGLSIVREVTEMYAGSVALEESDFGGLRVTVRLPGVTQRLESPRQN
ncbi:MAG: GHKL domain-containing protein, partial [Gammaproteobacteria bacterium]|nr:GHKL domain-containing protein [Gammaproteobacteria bacterium]